MKKILGVLVSIALISFTSFTFAAEDTMMKDKMMDKTGTMMQHDSSLLIDVTNGLEVRGIITPDNASGYAHASYADGEFSLHAEFTNLATPKGDDFYEGWAVQQNPFKFISTGKLEILDGKYINHFTSSTDYSSYDFYVLTLEPNDGDEAPADHIFEGDVVMKTMMMKDTMEAHTVTFDITGKNYSYSQNEIRVKKGDTVTINFESIDGYHDWVVDEFDAATEKVNPGTMTSVTFVADETGTFEYYCSVGNHRGQGMIGKLIVEDTKMMEKQTMMKDDEKMMMEKKSEMTAKRDAVKSQIQAKVKNLSQRKVDIILERVAALRIKLETLDISKAKKMSYNETLDIFVEVLSSGEMMMKKEETMMQK